MNRPSIFSSSNPYVSSVSSTVFSSCRKYRYSLWRQWADDWNSNYAMFVGLNPSTADEMQDDPTVRRCINFAKNWGYSGLCMTNLFAYRATNPKDMLAADDPIGQENNQYLLELAAKANIVIAAWGNHGAHCNRGIQVAEMLLNLHCLKVTKTGMPSHPLYLPQVLKPVPFDVLSSDLLNQIAQ